MKKTVTSLFALSSIMLSACTPSWSIKLQPVEQPAHRKVTVIDNRTADQKTFRNVDFVKLSYKAYLGDMNTSPSRIELLEAKLNNLAATNITGAKVVISQFDILMDRSGSACPGCALAAVSYPAAIIASAGRTPGDDAFICTLNASLDGIPFTSEVMASYHNGPLDTLTSDPARRALQNCLDGAIDKWIQSTGK